MNFVVAPRREAKSLTAENFPVTYNTVYSSSSPVMDVYE